MLGMEGSKAQITTIPRVVDELCRVCARCPARSVCRSKAIMRIDPDEPPFIDPSRCYGCQICIAHCPHGAIVASGRG